MAWGEEERGGDKKKGKAIYLDLSLRKYRKTQSTY
jgi:hypothetical protein